jgi:hypothetical protein
MSESKSTTEITDLVTDPQELTDKDQQSVVGGKATKAPVPGKAEAPHAMKPSAAVAPHAAVPAAAKLNTSKTGA